MRVLVACEYSGRVRDASAAKGHDAWSCDILKSDLPGQHYQGDVRVVIKYGCPNCNGARVARERWGNQCNSGQNKLTPSPTRWKDRSRTYQGIAQSMADQWG